MSVGEFYERFIVSPPVVYSHLYKRLKSFHAKTRHRLQEIWSIENPEIQRVTLMNFLEEVFGDIEDHQV